MHLVVKTADKEPADSILKSGPDRTTFLIELVLVWLVNTSSGRVPGNNRILTLFEPKINISLTAIKENLHIPQRITALANKDPEIKIRSPSLKLDESTCWPICREHNSALI
jgi:hypothetical protein